MRFKLLAAALLLIMAGWSAWWLFAASAQKAALEGWMAAQRADGWVAEAASIDVAGYPNRLDATLSDLALANPAEGWSWEAERLAIRQVAYDPTFFIVHFPPESRIAVPGARARLTADKMEASLKLADASAVAVERASFDAQLPGLAAEAGWTASAERVTLHMRAAPDAGPENAYEFRLDALRLRPPEFIRRIADPARALPAAIDVAAAEGRAALDRPLDRFALEGAPPQIQNLSLKEARATWGELDFALTGAARADEDGYAEGEFDISARNWRQMLDAAVAAGAIPKAMAETLKTGLGFVAGLGGDPDELNVALTMSGGFTRIGPVPIGPAPRLTRSE
ncbi:MAG: DUF2125 domain-containing protein [Pseudomonadota bacterium]